MLAVSSSFGFSSNVNKDAYIFGGSLGTILSSYITFSNKKAAFLSAGKGH